MVLQLTIELSSKRNGTAHLSEGFIAIGYSKPYRMVAKKMGVK
jgi:hypothetical protein